MYIEKEIKTPTQTMRVYKAKTLACTVLPWSAYNFCVQYQILARLIGNYLGYWEFLVLRGVIFVEVDIFVV